MSAPLSKVLLVDDEPKLLAALRRRLSTEFDVATAQSGPEALRLIKDDPSVAVIIADMQMPEMNGIELLKRVRDDAPHIRRMMLTGNADQETAIAAVNEGQVMRFLRKPCDAETLKDAILHAFNDIRFERADGAAAPAPDANSDADGGVNAAREAFLAMMNHELRTPLNHIIGLANLLDTERPIGADPASHEYLRQIGASGEHLLHIVNRVLEYSKLRSDQREDRRPGTIDLVALVHKEVDRLRGAASKKLVTISVDSLRKRVEVTAHEGELRMAVRELLLNAIKFNRAEGHVSVVIKCDPEWAAIRISDTGAGMPKEFVARAGVAFSQAEGGPARRYDGVGLGLALVSTIAQSNNGALRIDSEEGRGVTATFALRRGIAAAATAAA